MWRQVIHEVIDAGLALAFSAALWWTIVQSATQIHGRGL